MTKDYAEERQRYREALEKIIRYKRTPRAYRHTTFEQLIKIAEEALKDDES